MSRRDDFEHLPRRLFLQLLAGAGAVSLAGCAADDLPGAPEAGVDPASANGGEDRKLYAFFSKSFNRDFERSPEWMTQLGIKKRYGEWNDWSDAFAEEDHRYTVADLEFMRTQIDRLALSDSMRISYDVFLFRNELRVANWPYRFHNYDVSHFGGPHQYVPSTLINQHRIDEPADAEAYIARLNATPKLFDQVTAFMREAEAHGITLPHFSYPLMIEDAKRAVAGTPFDNGDDNPMFADFKAKVAKLSIGETEKDTFIEAARDALVASVKPAYAQFIQTAEAIGAHEKTDHGVGTLPDGARFYEERIRNHTTLPLKAQEIHQLGLSEVARLSTEMEGLKKKAGFRRPLRAFYDDLRSDPKFFYPNTDAGREAYRQRVEDLLAGARAALPRAFGVLPKADIAVKRMDRFVEVGQTIAYYEQGTPDGSRPGYVRLNLSDMSKMPKWQMAALNFHEGIPGHHLQISIAQESKSTPDFRKYTFFTSYIEGWALYTELLAKEMGLYKTVYDDIGRVAMELWRGCRLVTDTGIHSMGWSREKCIDYYLANTPLTDDNIRREINRYFVFPGQACAYQIGKNKIVELRERSKAALGPRFDIRAFHDAVLKNGAVPLPVLERLVGEWVQAAANA
ncbi:MAG: DUF885 family protein [Alphaproteobacteria bacterium]|nr:DUF885 family protein [Alphaproteobacteria bacterium]